MPTQTRVLTSLESSSPWSRHPRLPNPLHSRNIRCISDWGVIVISTCGHELRLKRPCAVHVDLPMTGEQSEVPWSFTSHNPYQFTSYPFHTDEHVLSLSPYALANLAATESRERHRDAVLLRGLDVSERGGPMETEGPRTDDTETRKHCHLTTLSFKDSLTE